MNTKQLNIFKTIIFIFGFVVIGVVFVIINQDDLERLTTLQKFFWIEVVLCYAVFFVPFFFSSIKSENIDTKITSTIHIWISVIIFEIVAIILAILSLNEIITIKISIIIELILMFFLSIFVYYGYFAGNHIGNVQAEQENSLNKIAEVKSAFDMLNINTQSWGSEFYEQKIKIKKLCDDVKYLSPVNTEMAFNLEDKMIAIANVIAETHVTVDEMNTKIQELSNLVSQRKLLRN